eukprot:403344105
MEGKTTVTHYAVCLMQEDHHSGVSGTVKFMQEEGGRVRISAQLTGLKPGLHGFHVHQFGNLTNGCVTAGEHYNPHKKTHAGPKDENRHVGDLGNIEVGADGVGKFDMDDDLIMIYGADNNIIGRAMVVHAQEDDLGRGGNEESLITGNAGGRLACGVIGLSGPISM